MSDRFDVASVQIPFADRELTLSGYVGEYVFETVRSYRRFYEGDLLEFVASLPLAPGAIIDVGANLGNHTVYLAEAFSEAKVFAVEPHGPNIELLRRNVAENGLDQRVEVVAALASDGHHSYELTQNLDGNLGTMAATRAAGGDIQSVILDELVGEQQVSLVKVDVEGMEPDVLRGLERTIGRCRPVIVTEAHDPSHTRAIAGFLNAFGYREVAIRGRSRNVIWAAPGATLDAHAVDTVIGQGSADSLFTLGREVRSGRDMTGRVGAQLKDAIERNVAATEQIAALLGDVKRVREEKDTEVETWKAAFTSLSRVMSVAVPHAWDHESAVRGAGLPSEVAGRPGPLETTGAGSAREVTRSANRDGVRVGMATMPGREKSLAAALASLAPQADEVFVWLNDMAQPPASIPLYDNVRYFTGEDLGDRGKFMFLEGFTGYYLTCDDDIHYPRHYVDSIVDGIERYGRARVVGWHGSVFKEPFENYYDSGSRRVFAFYSHRPHDTAVHLLGTGATGFHTSTIDFAMSDMPVANMADVWFAINAREQGVGLVVLKHEKKLAYPLDTEAPSISTASMGRDEGTAARRLDMRQIVTQEIAARAPWPDLSAFRPVKRDTMNVAIVGRTDRKRWKKGGILKSCHLMADVLRKFGAEVTLADIETGDPIGLGGVDADAVIVYVGDPQRPDFARVIETVRTHAARGRVVLVNLSLLASDHRANFIVEQMQEWIAEYGDLVQVLVFANSARDTPELAPIRDNIVTLPKTIQPLEGATATFAGTRGVFVGDIAKLSDERIIEGDAREWIGAIREALPGVPLIGLRQYNPRFDHDFGLDEIWPYSHHGLADRLVKMRAMVSLARQLTFEMVPVEAASLGVPVFYRHMPHSLSETLSLGGVQVESPDELAAAISTVYHDPIVWRSFSAAGQRTASAVDVDAMAGQFYLRIKMLVDGARRAQ
ncbi:FkbM family methyltransferase [Demequina mangrovi]|uniref:Methyltransferase, FkbM family n=1 Tax=Demequina mangrovi TaxID=1043493 RepID=A0A1H6Z6F8_9MICO|nr:FkbM family methyltransferase [Demequina mangrovi]SEJ48968.1 methyltransferase, FkbM family [Demequina mangrovi]